MGWITRTAGEKLTAAQWNSEVRDQVVSQVTSGSRPGTPTAGMKIYETDTNRFWFYDGAQWIPERAYCQLDASSQTIAKSNPLAYTDLSFGTQEETSGETFWTVGNSTRILLPYPGKWRVGAALLIQWDGFDNINTSVRTRWQLNNSSAEGRVAIHPDVTNDGVEGTNRLVAVVPDQVVSTTGTTDYLELGVGLWDTGTQPDGTANATVVVEYMGRS